MNGDEARKADCVSHIEPALQAAAGLHALVDGLISNWVLHPENFDLEKESHGLIKTYVDGLRYSLS